MAHVHAPSPRPPLSSLSIQESIARVKSLSLSGKLLYPIADKFMVQWPDLLSKYPRAKYVGFVI